MVGITGATWTRAQLETLLSAYFGDRLSPAEVERLVADVAAALVDRRAARLTLPERCVAAR